MKNKASMAVVVMVAALSGACGGGAQLVRQDALGGSLNLRGAYMPAMAEARLKMAEHCQGRFVAVEREDAVSFRCQREHVVARAAEGGRF